MNTKIAVIFKDLDGVNDIKTSFRHILYDLGVLAVKVDRALSMSVDVNMLKDELKTARANHDALWREIKKTNN